MISDEYQIKAACINRDAAESMKRSAEQMESAVFQLRTLLEDGYGNNLSKLVELLFIQEGRKAKGE